MGQWVETYRGMVKAWELDPVEHFTVAFYYNRISDATLNFFALSDLGPRHMRSTRRALVTVESFARYQAELRSGDVLHIESGVTGTDARGVTLAHKLFNSATGEVAALFELTLRYMDLERHRGVELEPEQRRRLEPYRVEWDGPERVSHPAPCDESAFIDTVYDTVKPWEIDVLGHMSLEFYVHRFSDASTQTLSAMGMSPPYMRAHRIGLSTFEFQARFLREFQAGDRVRVRSALMHVGNSSIRLLSRMYDADTGELAAELSQYGVHLDMDARRPSRIPDAIRDRGRRLTARTEGG